MRPTPQRPRLPRVPLAPPAVGMIVGILVDRFADPFGTTAWATLAGVAAIVALVARSGRVGLAGLIVVFAALGGGWHHHRWSDLAEDDLARLDWETPRPTWLRGALVEVPVHHPGIRSGDDGHTGTVLHVTGRCDGRDWHSASGRVQVILDDARLDLRPGMPVMAVGSLGAIPTAMSPGERDRREAYRADSVRLRLIVDGPGGLWPDPEGVARPFPRWVGTLRMWSHDRLVARLDPQVAPLAAALLLGRREAVDPDVNDAFARTGTTHLLAISGLHMQALAVSLWWAFRLLALRPKTACLGVAAATAAYCLLVGGMPSVVRSTVMTLALSAAVLRDRPAGTGGMLALAAIITLAFNPAYLFDVGCQLSFLCVAALFWCVSPVGRRLRLIDDPRSEPIYADLGDPPPPDDPLDALERRFEPPWKKAIRWAARTAARAIVLSAVVWAVGLPLSALRFHLVSPIAIVLNLPLIPITTLALFAAGATLLLAAIWPPLGAPSAWACERLLDLTETILRWGASQTWGHRFVAGPTWPWVLAFYVLLGAAMLASAIRWRWRAATWAALAGVSVAGLAASTRPAPPAALEADVLAVGHGLAVVIQRADGRTLLYDCGRMGDPTVGRRVIAPALWSRRVRRLDAVILSHADADHYNGLPELLDRFPIGEVFVPPGFGGPTNPEATELLRKVASRGIPIRPIVAGDRLDLGPGAVAEALHPPANWRLDDADNIRSVVLDVSSRGRHLLLTGDLDGPGLFELAALPRRPIDAMLAPHHGGRSANPPWLYEWADPGLVVVSQRRPTPGTRDPLASLGKVPLLRTWRSGAIRLRWEDRGIVARSFLDRSARAPARSPSKSRPSIFWPWASLPPLPLRLAAAILGLMLGLGLCASMAVIEWGAWALVRPGRRVEPAPIEPAPWLPIEIDAADGVRLRGAWSPSAEANGRTALLLHGFGEDRAALLGRGEALAGRGWNVALLDGRGRGRSDGAFITFGAREADDLAAWIEHLRMRVGPDFRGVAWGRSMGATIAIKAAGSGLLALVLEAPYADLRATVAARLRLSRIPAGFAGPLLRRAGRLAGMALDAPRPIDLAARVGVPALVLHGTDDPIVSRGEVGALVDALPNATLVEVVGARHNDVFDVGGAALTGQIVTFLDEAIGIDSQ